MDLLKETLKEQINCLRIDLGRLRRRLISEENSSKLVDIEDQINILEEEINDKEKYLKNLNKLNLSSVKTMAEASIPPFIINDLNPVRTQSETIDWGMNTLQIPQIHKEFGLTGKGVKVAVIDTLVNSNHEDLVGAIIQNNNVTNENIPEGNGHGCISPTDTIYTSFCGSVAISDFYNRVGDSITFLNQDGSTTKDISNQNIETYSFNKNGFIEKNKVTHVHELQYEGDQFLIKTRGSKINLTPWHPIYIVSKDGKKDSYKKIRADELKLGDKIISSNNPPNIRENYIKIPHIQYFQCVYCNYKSITNEKNYDGRSVQCKKCNKNKWHSGIQTSFIELNEELAYIAGLIYSDGNLYKNPKNKAIKIRFSNKDLSLIESFENYMKLFSRTKTNRVLREETGCYEVCCRDKKLYNVFEKIGVPTKNKSKNGRFPELISKSKLSVIYSFIAGIIDGDGSIDKSGKRIRVATASEMFAKDMVSLLKNIGISSTYLWSRGGKYGDIIHIKFSLREEILKYLKSIFYINISVKKNTH